jgi:hypothetical protein
MASSGSGSAAQVEGHDFHAALGHFGGVFHAQAPGSGVARILKALQSLFGARRVHGLEALPGNDHFAPHFSHRDPALVKGGAKGHAAQDLHVGADVFALHAIAPGRAPAEHALGVLQGNAGAVKLGLYAILERFGSGEGAHPPIPFQQVIGVVGILQRKHGHGVGRRFKAVAQPARYALRGRIGG